ncbi:MAG: hypothetical protein PHY57_13885, partial [Ignavibacterium sp.]|nr:hypothetical protein [Ignavibacterium sp.]
MNNTKKHFSAFIIILVFFTFLGSAFSQSAKDSLNKFPIVLDTDTLFYVQTSLGVFSPEKRADEITLKIKTIASNDTIDYDSIKIVPQTDFIQLQLFDEVLFVVTKDDAAIADTTEIFLAESYRKTLIEKLNERRVIYSQNSMIKNGVYTLVYLVLSIVFFWITTKIFPRLYKKIEQLDESKIKTVTLKDKAIIQS